VANRQSEMAMYLLSCSNPSGCASAQRGGYSYSSQKDAERWLSRALAIDPHNTQAASALLITRLNATGDVDSARRALDGFPDGTKSLTREWFAAGGDVAGFSGIWVYLDVIERRFTDAFQALEKKVVSNDLGHLQHLAARVALRVLAGEHEAAKSAGEEAPQVASIARLKIDPVWDPIRNHSDFQQLLAGTEQIGPNK